MAITIVSSETFEEDGLPYIKETYSNGTVVVSLNTEYIPEPEPVPEPEPDYISKNELDAAYREGVNAYV